VEVIPDSDILKVRAVQPKSMRGLAGGVRSGDRKQGAGGNFDFVFVERIGRFGGNARRRRWLF